MATPDSTPAVAGEPCKLITVVLQDNGTDLALLRKLRREKGVIRAGSFPGLGSSILAEAKTRPGKLPEPITVRVVQIVVSEAQADDVFEFVCENAEIRQPGGGVVFQGPAPFATPYAFPENVLDEDE